MLARSGRLSEKCRMAETLFRSGVQPCAMRLSRVASSRAPIGLKSVSERVSGGETAVPGLEILHGRETPKVEEVLACSSIARSGSLPA
jgi:hypothetical protein